MAGSEARLSTGAASDVDAVGPSRGGGAGKIAIFAAKLLVTGACFWYLSRQINLGQVISALPLLDFRWAAFAVLVVMLEIPLGGLRWSAIVDALATRDERVTRTVMIGVTAIGVFFAQVLPSVAGDGVRAWLLARLGGDWRNAVISVVLDRAIGAGLLVALSFAILLLLPTGLMALDGYRDLVLVVYGGLLLAGALGLLLAPKLAPLLARWRYSRWLAKLAVDARRVLFWAERPADLGARMSHPRAHHRGGLGGRARSGPCPAPVRCRRVVHGNDRRGPRTDLDQRLGLAGACRHRAARKSRYRAGTGIAFLGLLRPCSRGGLAARSVGLAILFVRAFVALCRARRVMAISYHRAAGRRGEGASQARLAAPDEFRQVGDGHGGCGHRQDRRAGTS